jgi:hypothetical protein
MGVSACRRNGEAAKARIGRAKNSARQGFPSPFDFRAPVLSRSVDKENVRRAEFFDLSFLR